MTPCRLAFSALLALVLAGATPGLAQGLVVQPPLDADMAAEVEAEAASPEGFSSAYTDLDFGQCTITTTDDFGTTWACPGHKGFPMRVRESELRFSLSFGFEAAHEKAAEQTPPPVNQLGDRVEWRLKSEAAGQRPVAAIAHYFLKAGASGEQAEVLAVTQIKEGATCHMAYVDMGKNADAEALARAAADKAGNFDCSGEPERIGEFSAW